LTSLLSFRSVLFPTNKIIMLLSACYFKVFSHCGILLKLFIEVMS